MYCQEATTLILVLTAAQWGTQSHQFDGPRVEERVWERPSMQGRSTLSRRALLAMDLRGQELVWT
ncbi:MAG TPA: hypothetical protein VGN26_12135 [Armatimonadota bacterium]|jgi:hypothetical protein